MIKEILTIKNFLTINRKCCFAYLLDIIGAVFGRKENKNGRQQVKKY